MRPPARPQAFVLLNPRSGGGRARDRWRIAAPRVEASVRPRIVELDPSGVWEREVADAAAEGHRHFIAAGGDGTVNALVDALARLRSEHALDAFTLGAVGLGSSNDLHKPGHERVAGIPVRLGPRSAPRDICRARFHLLDGEPQERHFVVSASLGLAARANAFFSGGDAVQRCLRACWTGGAILHATARTVVHHRNLPARIRSEGRDMTELAITNLSVSKTPWVSGGFRYDTPADPADGLLSVNLCDGLDRVGTVRVLLDLSRGRFAGGAGRRHWRTPALEVSLQTPAELELDGEVFQAREVAFDVLRERVQLWN